MSELADFVTGAEIGRRLGISRERVSQLARGDDFPQALGRVGQAKVWRWDDVERWAVAAGRRPHNPTTTRRKRA